MTLQDYIAQLRDEIDNPKVEKQPKKSRKPGKYIPKGVQKVLESLNDQ
jgi:hypothetical protein